MYERGRRARALDLLLQAPAAFLRNYILRRGVLDGSVGLLLSMVNAYSVFLKFAKLWELQRTVSAAREREAAHGGSCPHPCSRCTSIPRAPGGAARVR